MVRLLALLIALVLWLFAIGASAAEPSRYKIVLGADLSYVDASGHPSWTEGSAGKLRYDDDHDGFMLSRAFADYSLRVADTLDAHLVAELYTDDIGSALDLTESYLEWRPLTLTANRYRLKLGAFYPRVSLENTDPGWSSPYTISPSALNTWIGEEFRVFGAEATVSRRPKVLGGLHNFTLQAAIFYNNDPAGTLLSWKGWSIHDRQTRFSDKLPIPPVPRIQPGNWFDAQDPFLAPFREIDNAAGYYLNAEWAIGNRLMLRTMHYDNRADPEAYEDGQFGWRTDFNHIGLKATLPGDLGLIAQWIKGTTVWGPVFNGAHAVDAGFYSDFILLTKAFSRHRVSVRYDRFDVSDYDTVPLDDNSEYGHAWTLAYQYEAATHASLAVEWLQIESYREAWTYFGLAEDQTERQLQVSVRLHFGNRP
jgi:hypothetical protein